MKIVTLPDAVLRKYSQDVVIPLSPEDDAIAQEMIAYIEKSKDPDSGLRPGVGIAAVQLGYLKRMFYVSIPQAEGPDLQELLINPKKIGESVAHAALEGGEGCLSVAEDVKGLVHRKAKVIVKGYSYFSKQVVEYRLEDYEAIVFQHELDHLDGKLYFDRIDKKEPNTPKKGEILI